jgi:hypothetical protein
MRKSSVIALAMLVVTFGTMLWLLGFYTDALRPELEASTEWTDDLRASLAPATKVKILRVHGSPSRAGKDPKTYGLLVDATPSKEAWARDYVGSTLALDLTRRAFERYGPDRPIHWVEVRLVENREIVRRLGFAKSEHGAFDAILTEGVPPPPSTPPAPRPRSGGIVPGPQPKPPTPAPTPAPAPAPTAPMTPPTPAPQPAPAR